MERKIYQVWEDVNHFSRPSLPSTLQVWQDLFSVRQLVVPMHDDVDNWLKFSSLCRKSGRAKQSERMLLQLLR